MYSDPEFKFEVGELVEIDTSMGLAHIGGDDYKVITLERLAGSVAEVIESNQGPDIYTLDVGHLGIMEGGLLVHLVEINGWFLKKVSALRLLAGEAE